MRGRYVRQAWRADLAIYAPPRYRRACEYDMFIPEPVAEIDVGLPGHVAGVVSEAEKAIADLNRAAGPELMPLARLPLRRRNRSLLVVVTVIVRSRGRPSSQGAPY